jgi:Cu/Ag efflux protein CusF
MKKFFLIFALTACALTAGAQVYGQTTEGAAATKTSTSVTANRVIGEVTAIDATAKQVTVKSDAGTPVAVMLDEKTIYLRTLPGAKNLEGAAKIALADIRIGDRVYARGTVAADQKSIATHQLVVMTKADIADKQERDREEWRRRGVVGTVSAVNPETKEITLQVRSFGGAQPVTIAAGGNVKFRRYAPDSVRFADAKPGSLVEIKVGDQLRAKGERSEDGTRFTPEEIVSGSFRSIRGTVESVNPEANEIKVKDMTSAQTVTIVISKDSMVRRIPAEFVQRMAMRGQGNGAAAANAQGNAQGDAAGAQQRPQGEGGGRRRPEGAAGAGGAEATAGTGMGRRRGGGPDMQEMLERMPAATVAELKPGEMVIVSSTVGADPTRATAIALVTGVDAFLQSPAGQRRTGGQGASLGLPSGALDIGIGLP